MKQSALARLGILALIWGSSFLWIKLADRGFSPVQVTFARLALGAAVLFPMALARREVMPRSAALWAQIVVAALFANAVPYLLFAVAEQSVGSATAGIINATTPLWTVLLAVAVRHQKSVTGWQGAGLIVGFGGALLIFSPWHAASSVASAGGLECLGASVSYAASFIYMDKFLVRRGMSPIALAACQLLVAAAWLAVALPIAGAGAPHPDAAALAGLVILGVLGTGVAYVLNYQIIASEGATVAATVTYLLPVVAIVLGVLFLGETVTVTVLGGIALVLCGVALTRRRGKAAAGRRQADEKAPGRTSTGTGHQPAGTGPRSTRSAMAADEYQPVRVSRRIEAPASVIFGVLADPRRHLEIDGSGMVRGAVTQAPVRAVGDVFTMRMYFSMHGNYEMNNHVVEFEQDRRIGWEPASGRGHPGAAPDGTAEARWGHRWSYELAPDGPGATIVTEIYDCSRAPEGARADMDDGKVWMKSMAETLERLDRACTGRRG